MEIDEDAVSLLISPGRPEKELTYTITALPLPDKKPQGVVRRQIFQILGELEVGKCLEINRTLHSMQLYAFRYRKLVDPETRFILRKGPQPRTTRIWRVK
jgi:hypothetical protein